MQPTHGLGVPATGRVPTAALGPRTHSSNLGLCQRQAGSRGRRSEDWLGGAAAVGGGGALALLSGFRAQRKGQRPRSRQPAVARFGRNGGGEGLRGTFLRPQTGVSTPVEEFVPPLPAGGTQFFKSFSELAAHYDAFTLDQYGVLHNGTSAYEGVEHCISQLRAAGKRMVVLSNYAGRAAEQIKKLPGIGIDPEHLDDVITSGELAHEYLHRYPNKFGKNVLWIAFKDLAQRGLQNYFSELPDYKPVSSARQANFILASGTGSLFEGTHSPVYLDFERTGDSIPFEKTFRRAIHNAIPMLCANPDHQAVRPGGWKAHLPGELAETYKRLGGRVIYFGKPSSSSFEAARRVFDKTDAGDRLCHVGDSLRHDIAGAFAAGFNSIFVVRTGIHAKELPEEPTHQDVFELCKKYKAPMPNAVVPSFSW